jgi:vancomycin permeability regulator SanA
MAEPRTKSRRPQPPPRSLGRRVAGHAAVALVSALVLLGAFNAYVIGTTRSSIVDDVGDVPPRPTGIVLGTRVLLDGTPASGLGERLELARELYRRGAVHRLIVSGAALPNGYDEPGAMARWLVARGVPAADIALDRGGLRTAATMANARDAGVSEALICTQSYHLPRALYLARHAGIDAIGVVAHAHGSTAENIQYFIREALARAQAVVEVAIFGVTAH